MPTSNIPRSRYRRTVPLWERIKSWPGDKLTEIQENWALKDWDAIEHSLSWPVSICLNGMSVFLRLGSGFDDTTKYDPSFQPTRSSLFFKLQYFEYSLLLISIINAMYVYMSAKKYHMFEHDIKNRPNSSNVHLQELGGIPPPWATGFLGNMIYSFYRKFFSISYPQDERQYVWVLTMWKPPVFFLDVFCYYSPAQVLVIHYLNLSILVRSFQSLIKDKQAIFGEVYNEYNMKLVHPHLFVRRYEVSTQTDPVSNWELKKNY
ncbi:4145_t:CDS:2 [Diversispora eburnea]|uniref:4145_t:CDS:1 n=1 Tax=Diversispora eburnea TaxID=1213867 RepID=A0A9N8V0G3_9GLOM|nr:4145_t:CDS:2 [Diversispora eburnea]